MYKFATIGLAIVGVLSPNALASHDVSGDKSQYTYFINGLGSAIPVVGKGLDSLSDKIGGSYFAYISPVESLTIIASVVSDVRTKLKHDPDTKFNIIGTSYGGNIATIIAGQLDQIGAKVNYLAVIDAPAPYPITPNVHRADNFVCRKIGCIGQKIRLEKENTSTWLQQFEIKSGHIALSQNQFVHDRVIGQLTETPLNLDEIYLEKETDEDKPK